MPEQTEEGKCVSCGRPSTTEVCMRCFFSYDFHTYEIEDEKRPALQMKTAPPPAGEWNEVIRYWDKEETKEMEELSGPSKPEEKITLSSLFSRLPRFG